MPGVSLRHTHLSGIHPSEFTYVLAIRFANKMNGREDKRHQFRRLGVDTGMSFGGVGTLSKAALKQDRRDAHLFGDLEAKVLRSHFDGFALAQVTCPMEVDMGRLYVFVGDLPFGFRCCWKGGNGSRVMTLAFCAIVGSSQAMRAVSWKSLGCSLVVPCTVGDLPSTNMESAKGSMFEEFVFQDPLVRFHVGQDQATLSWWLAFVEGKWETPPEFTKTPIKTTN